MNEFRRWAAKMDQHMQQLAAQGVNDAPAILHRMMGYAPDLHQIWTGTTDDQLLALSHEFPGFYRYARIMEEAFEAERRKASRPYDGMAPLSEANKQRATHLLTTAATLERGYQAFLASGNAKVAQPQVHEMDQLHQQWLSDLERFKSALRAQGAESRALEYVNEAFGHIAERIKQLAG
ncbi:MAG TPA: transposase [Candidatus Competibacteraceae bacterium]|nr:transposase [Candidatus Competibacteraceae bacterium]